MTDARPITLLVCALGGEGGGVLTEWLIDAARHAGYAAQSTSIPGVAQRTGATTYYVEMFPLPMAQLQGRTPVFSLSPAAGALDAIVSSELLETVRQIGNGMSDPQRTLVISSSARTLTTAERMQPGDGRADAGALVDVVRRYSRAHHIVDMGAAAREAGTIVSAVMLGAIAGSGLLPLPRAAYEHVIRGGDTQAPEKLDRVAQASLRGFARGFDAIATPRAQAAMLAGLLDGDGALAPDAVDAATDADTAAPLPEVLRALFPPPVHAMLALGHARLVDYQGDAYARRYVDKLRQVLAAEEAADAQRANGYAITREMARWLALWMAFDDIIRVADLKSRASRARRVRAEVKAGDGDLLKVYDHFKPGVPEFAALLPAGLAQPVLAWDRRRRAAGKAPWALPLKVGSHSVAGMLSLRLLAALRALRPHGSRFGEEMALIDRWLAVVVGGTRAHWRLGHEVALCGRLIKGYGSTNERGKQNLLHVIDHLAVGPLPDAPEPYAMPLERAAAIAAAREAALADEGGVQLDAALARHGAPPRPVREQPIRWMRRPGAAAATTSPPPPSAATHSR